MIFDEILEQAHEIHDLTRKLNMSCSRLSGTAVTIPADAPYPLDYFAGRKVIVHNARYSFAKYSIVASIKVPYPERRNESLTFGGEVLEFTLDEKWFK